MSFRLGGTDGVAIEAAKWCDALRANGHDVRTVAGEGNVDVIVPGLGLRDERPVTDDHLAAVLDTFDLVIVENLLSLPLTPAATDAVARARAGRPTIVRHHDLPWQRPQWVNVASVPDDPTWTHVTINDWSRRELAERGIVATTEVNRFDCDPPRGHRDRTRDAIGITTEPLVLFPTRAIPRKNVEAAFDLCRRHDAVLWLLGPAEDDYAPTVRALIKTKGVEVREGRPADTTIHDAYAAADLVVVPSTWEGFGNPVLESVTHERPLAVHPYPVLSEITQYGFAFPALTETDRIDDELHTAHPERRAHHLALARAHFNLADLPARLGDLMDRALNPHR